MLGTIPICRIFRITSIEEMVHRIGHVTLAQVHAVLAYYYANREEIEADIAAEEAEGDTKGWVFLTADIDHESSEFNRCRLAGMLLRQLAETPDMETALRKVLSDYFAMGRHA